MNDDGDEPLYKPSYNALYKHGEPAPTAVEILTDTPEGYVAGRSPVGSVSVPDRAAFALEPVGPTAEMECAKDDSDGDDESLHRIAAYTRSASISARTAAEAAAAVAARTAALSERLSFGLQCETVDALKLPSQSGPHGAVATESNTVSGFGADHLLGHGAGTPSSTAPTAAVAIALVPPASGVLPKKGADSSISSFGAPPAPAGRHAQCIPEQCGAGDEGLSVSAAPAPGAQNSHQPLPPPAGNVLDVEEAVLDAPSAFSSRYMPYEFCQAGDPPQHAAAAATPPLQGLPPQPHPSGDLQAVAAVLPNGGGGSVWAYAAIDGVGTVAARVQAAGAPDGLMPGSEPLLQGVLPPQPSSGTAERPGAGADADVTPAPAAHVGWHPEPDRAVFEDVSLLDTGASGATAAGGGAWLTTVRQSGTESVIGTVELRLDPPEFVATVEHPVFEDPDVSAGLISAAPELVSIDGAATAVPSQGLLDDYRIAAAAGLVSPELASLLGLAPPPAAAVNGNDTAAASGSLLSDGRADETADVEEEDDEEEAAEAVAAVALELAAEPQPGQELMSYVDAGEIGVGFIFDGAAVAGPAAPASDVPALPAAPPPAPAAGPAAAALLIPGRPANGDPFDAADTDDEEGAGSPVVLGSGAGTAALQAGAVAAARTASQQPQQHSILPAAAAAAPEPGPHFSAPAAAHQASSVTQSAGSHLGIGVAVGVAAVAAAGVSLAAAAAGQRAAAAVGAAQQGWSQAPPPQWQEPAPGAAPAGHQPPPLQQEHQDFQQLPPPPYSVAVQDQGGQKSPPGMPLPTSLRPSASPGFAAGPRPGAPQPHSHLLHSPPPPGSPTMRPQDQQQSAYGSHPSFRGAGGPLPVGLGAMPPTNVGPQPGGPGLGPGPGLAAMGAMHAAAQQQGHGAVSASLGRPPFGLQGAPGAYGAPQPQSGVALHPAGMPGPGQGLGGDPLVGPAGMGPGMRPPLGGPGVPPHPMAAPGRNGLPAGPVGVPADFRPPPPGAVGARPPPLQLQAPPPPSPYPGLLYTEGRDTLGRPVVVLNTAMLPAKAKKSDVLQYVLRQLQPVVQRDYVVIVLSLGMGVKAGSVSSTWALGAYRSLAKPYRKNVKHIVLVQPSAWARALLALAQPFVSKKAAHKVKKVDNLVQVSEATGGEVKLESLGARFIREIQYGLGAPPLAGLMPPLQGAPPGGPTGPGPQQQRPPMPMPMGPLPPRGPMMGPVPGGGPSPPGYLAPPYPGPQGSYVPPAPRPMQPPPPPQQQPGSAIATPVYGPGGPGTATAGRIQGPPPPRPQFPPGPSGPGGGVAANGGLPPSASRLGR